MSPPCNPLTPTKDTVIWETWKSVNAKIDLANYVLIELYLLVEISAWGCGIHFNRHSMVLCGVTMIDTDGTELQIAAVLTWQQI